MRFILASASPRRKQILEDLGFDFIVVAMETDEIESDILPLRIPVRNAIAKAEAVSNTYPDDLVLGADTVIEFAGKVVGKPENPDAARRILRNFSGRRHAVVTSVCLLCPTRRIRCVFSETTQVVFKLCSDLVIEDYLARVHVMDKAGAYAAQEYGEMLIERIEGSTDNVVGLPSGKVMEALYSCGLASLMLKQAPSR